MENASNWYFTKEQLANSPSRKSGIDYARELSYRQQAANFIQDMGQRLQVSQLCINTAIVYMHRFYAFHSFSDVHRNNLAICALFLAAKVEEQPRKLEHVIKVAHVCLHKDSQSLDVRSEAYLERMNEVVAHENILLQTLGFVLAIEHPHTYVVKVCQLVKASKDLAQTSYIMATTSLHMTTMCLLYKPTVVACVCIHLACKWSNYMIEPCSEGRDWFYYVDRSVTWELIEKLTQEYISILERSPHRFKKKFGKDAAAGYHGPSSITIDEPLHNRPSTSSDSRNSSTRKDSPGSSFTGGSYDFGAEFEEKRMLKYESPPEKSSSAAASGSSSQSSSQKHTNHGPEAVAVKVEVPEAEKVEVPVVKTEPHVPKSKHPKHRINSVMHDSGDKVPASSSTASSQSNQKYLEPVAVKVEPEEAPVAPVVKTEPVAKSKHPKHRMNSLHHDGQSVAEPVPQGNAKGPSPSKDIKTNGSKEDPRVHAAGVDNDVGSKRMPDVLSKHERREKHKSKHSSHSSKDRQFISNHSEQSTGIKVKIRKDIINLSESPKMPLKIKLPKPPMPESPLPPLPKPAKHETPTSSLKLVITKDKSGSGSYSTSHKNERESRKRVHSSSDSSYKNSHELQPSKYPKQDHTPKTHHVDAAGVKQNKVSSRHSVHRDHTTSNSTSARLPGMNDSTFHNYNAVSANYPSYSYQQLTAPPPPPAKLRGHGMLVGKTNSNPPLPPPLPPPPPPPPE